MQSYKQTRIGILANIFSLSTAYRTGVYNRLRLMQFFSDDLHCKSSVNRYILISLYIMFIIISAVNGSFLDNCVKWILFKF